MGNVTNKNSKTNKKYRKKAKSNKPLNDAKDDSREIRASGTNDPDWYARNPALLRDAGSYSFGNPLGNSTRVTELSQFDSSINYRGLSNLDTPVPGVAVIEYIPTYGGSQEELPAAFNSANPINTIARAIYSSVREANSGSWTYEPADLMKYLIAMDNIYMFYSWMTRLYGLARVYSAVNRYWPKALVFASHVDFDDMMQRLADLRYYINSFVVRANQLAVPDNMPIYLRHLLMNAGVYKDKESDKAQLYMFNPRFLYVYNEQETPSRLDPVNINAAVGTGTNNLLTVADIMQMGDDMLSRVLTSEDIGIITGDIMKKFSNFVKLNAVDTDYSVYPNYDPVIASQIQNARLVGDVLVSIPDKFGYIFEGTTNGVDAGMLYQQIASTNELPVINLAHPLSIDKDMASITPVDVVEATRLTSSGKVVYSADTVSFQSLVCECGAEVCTKIAIVTLNMTSGQPEIFTTIAGNGLQINGGQAADRVMAMSAFDKHPIFWNMNSDKTTGAITFPASYACYDYDNYTVIGRNGLRKLHELALWGLFGIGEDGKYVG